jgi:broad specificity phosphatase PhoE
VCEGVRERIGHHPCDKRRTVSELKPQFPQFSFDAILDEEDCLWSEAREPTEDILQRARAFLDVLRQRPGEPLLTHAHSHLQLAHRWLDHDAENCIGVVSHSAFLTAMFVVLTTECGLPSDGPDGRPDITSASSPDAVAHGGPMNGESKPYFANGEVKTVVILPHSLDA